MGKKKNAATGFLVHGSVLAIAGIVVRIIGLVYRIPMTNIIGEEGIGVYSTAYTVYNVLLLISSYSLPVAVSRLIAGRLGVKQYKNAHRIFLAALMFAAVMGVTFCLIAFFGSDFFARVIMGMPEAAYAIRVLAPTILIMAFLGTLRGYFQGHSTMMPTATSQVIEQIFNAIVSVAACYFLFNQGAARDAAEGTGTFYSSALGAAGGTYGTLVGAASALVFCGFVFFVYSKTAKRQLLRDRTPENAREPMLTVTRLIVLTVIPVLISTTVYQISLVVDQSIFAQYIGADYKQTWGAYSGKYNLLVNVPVAVANALASSIIPALSAAHARRDVKDEISKTAIAIRFSMLIAMPCATFLTFLAQPSMRMLFSGENVESGMMMTLGASAIVFYSLSTITNSILQGIGNIWIPVRNAIISLAVHVAVLFILLWGFGLGIYGVVFANILFALLMCILNNLSVGRILKYRQEFKKTFIMPLVCSIVMGAASFAIYQVIYKVSGINLISVIIAALAAIIIYAVLLLVSRTVGEREIMAFPKGGSIVRLAKRLHLIRG